MCFFVKQFTKKTAIKLLLACGEWHHCMMFISLTTIVISVQVKENVMFNFSTNARSEVPYMYYLSAACGILTEQDCLRKLVKSLVFFLPKRKKTVSLQSLVDLNCFP